MPTVTPSTSSSKSVLKRIFSKSKDKGTPNKQLSINVNDELLANATNDSFLVGAIDQGTSSTRFLVFNQQGRVVASSQVEHTQYYPHVGWHEHDPIELWASTQACLQSVAQVLAQKNNNKISAIGITNQRETTIAWNKVTGKPYYNAIVWDDLRTSSLVHQLGDPKRLAKQTGLPISAYFAGLKVKWLLDHVPALQVDLANAETREQVCFGTVDSWLLFQLTGQQQQSTTGSVNVGGTFATDVTNASRWLFLNLTKNAHQWDTELVNTICEPHVLPTHSALPTIHPSSHIFGYVHSMSGVHPLFHNVPIASILGDQQAALFGQVAFQPGEAKNTYGTGLFLMMNTGTTAVPSTHGLLTTIAYQLEGQPVVYALEGSVSHSGSTIQWLRDQLQLITSAEQSELLATEANDGVYFVPAFAGLFAPHWRDDARACIVGLTASHHRGHICRAALEATAYQTKEVLDAIQADSNVQLVALKVDGGGTNNQLMMQFQADMINVPVVKPVVMETTSMGAAFAAGLAVGVWNDLEQVRKLWAVAHTFQPSMSEVQRTKNWRGWNRAVDKSLGWAIEDMPSQEDDYDTDDAVFEDAREILPDTSVEDGESRWKTATSTAAYLFSLTLAAGIGAAAGFFLAQRRKT